MRVAWLEASPVSVIFSSHRQSSTGSVVVTATCATSPLSQITYKTKASQHASVRNTEVGEEDQRVLCIDDVTSTELPWNEVRQAREQELKLLRDFGVYEKVDEREANAQAVPGHSGRHEVD